MRAVSHSIYAAAMACVFFGANEARAQNSQKHTLRYEPKFKVGDRWRLTQKSSNEVRHAEAPAEGKSRVKSFKNVLDFEGTCTAKTVSENGTWSEISVEVAKCSVKNDRQTVEVLKPGQNIIATDRDGKRTFTLADGGALFGEKQQLLQMAIGGSRSQEEDAPLEDLFVLKTSRKVGDKWQPDADLLLKSLLGFAKDLTAKDVEGSAEFTAVEQVNGKAALKWTGRMKAETKNPPVAMPGGVPVLGSFDWKSEQTIPASGDRGTWRKVMTADIKQVFKGKPGSEQADTTFEGASKQVDDTTIEFLDESK